MPDNNIVKSWLNTILALFSTPSCTRKKKTLPPLYKYPVFSCQTCLTLRLDLVSHASVMEKAELCIAHYHKMHHIAHIHAGKKLRNSSPKDLLRSPRHADIFCCSYNRTTSLPDRLHNPLDIRRHMHTTRILHYTDIPSNFPCFWFCRFLLNPIKIGKIIFVLILKNMQWKRYTKPFLQIK